VNRLTTGAPQLDQVLGGSFRESSFNVAAGLSGTGKTILAEQFLIAKVSEDAPGPSLSTLSDPLTSGFSTSIQFTFFDDLKIPNLLHYEDLGQRARAGRVKDSPWGREARPLVVDSFKALHTLAGEADMRTTAFQLRGDSAAGWRIRRFRPGRIAGICHCRRHPHPAQPLLRRAR
jgi:circadian clock protein KaiC